MAGAAGAALRPKLQVTRAVDEDFARDRRMQDVAVRKTDGRGIGTQLQRAIGRKQSQVDPRQVLVVDSSTVYWSVLFSGRANQSKLRAILDDLGWKGVVLVGTSVIEAGNPWSCARCDVTE